ncbi:MAG TPA: FeoB small GTPase domain-containing protein [Thermodesulfobacteriota bacterium]|nr:FeoB small GTPase domain-containing protein [Thermodesulfobacteriota bacterium]
MKQVCSKRRNNLPSSTGPKHAEGTSDQPKKIVIIGNPNVGKSVLFNNLTNHYVTVSNYPGTSVEVTSGFADIKGMRFEVIDTPGMYSLTPITEEERVGRKILIQGRPDIVLHVVDAKNIERMLAFTLQLIEAGLPVILVLNMMDEAQKAGMKIDFALLEKLLGIPVVGTISTTKKGMDILKERIVGYAIQKKS